MGAARKMDRPEGLARDVFAARTPRDAFVILLHHGFWPVAIYPRGAKSPGRAEPCEGKEPIGKAWGLERWTLERANAEFRRVKGAGVGICLGPGRGPGGTWPIDAEGDGPEAEQSRLVLFGGELVETLGWASARGGHGLMTVDPGRIAALLPRLKSWESKDKNQAGVYKSPLLPGLELRIGGYKPDGVTVKQVQSVVPPTRRTDGQPREWTGPAIVRPVPEAFYRTLEELAPKAPASKAAGPNSGGSAADWKVRAVGGMDQDHEARRIANYVMMALADEAAKVAGTPIGARHDAMLKASVNMAGLIKGANFPEGVYRRVLAGAADACDLPWGEASALIESALQMATPRDMARARAWNPERDDPKNGRSARSNGQPKDASNPSDASDASDASKTAPPTAEELGLTCLDDIEVKPVEWLWPDRLPRGKITLLAGEGEIGKTFMTLDLIARLTTGRPWPDHPDVWREPCDCIFVTAEDGLGDTIKPRLLNMGADVKRVFTIGTAKLPNGRTAPFTIADIDRLEWIMAIRPEIRFIGIDPIASFLGRVDENKNADLRAVLGPLSDFADRYDVSILTITHFGKNPSTKATTRILGSVAYSNAARVTWCVVADPDNDDRRLMLRVKNNLSPNKTGMAYTLQEGKVTWEPIPINQKVADVLESGNAKPTEKVRAKLDDFLRDLLSPAPMPSDAVIDKARAAGFGKDSVWTAKKRLGIKAIKNGMEGGWSWKWTGPIPEASEASEASEGFEASEPSLNLGRSSTARPQKCPDGLDGLDESFPSSPQEISRIRAIVATWSIEHRQRYGDLSNQLEEEGHSHPADEIEAFARVSAEKDQAEGKTNGSPFAGKG